MYKRYILASLFFLFGCIFPFITHAELEIPAPTGYVWDSAEVLSNDGELEEMLSNLAETSIYEMAIVTLPQLPADETIETAAEKIFNTWGIGDGEEDTGLLLIISIGDRISRLEVGYGVEGVIPDILAKRYTDSMSPYFRESNFDGGVMHATTEIIAWITDENNTPASVAESIAAANKAEEDDVTMIIFLFILFLIFSGLFAGTVSYLGKDKSIWFGGVAGAALGAVASIIFDAGVGAIITGGIIGLILDWFASNGGGGSGGSSGGSSWSGGSSGSSYRSSSSSSSSFGGFSGGRSGGGGASSSW